MPNGLKITFTVLIVLALVAIVPVLETVSLVQATALNPRFYEQSMDSMYDSVYDIALEGVALSIDYSNDGVSDESAARLAEAIRNTLPPKDMSLFMREAAPGILNYILHGGDAPVIDYDEIIAGIRKGFWDSYVFQDMLADKIAYTVERAKDDAGEISEELIDAMENTLFADIRINSYYMSDARDQAYAVIHEAYLAAAQGEDIDLSEMPFPDAVEFRPISRLVKELPFSAQWDTGYRADFEAAMDNVRDALSFARVLFWCGWAGALILLSLLYVIWMKRPAIFMNVTGGMLIANGAAALMFALGCGLSAAPFAYLYRWAYWDVPARLMEALRALTVSIGGPFARISLIAGVLLTAAGVTLIVLAAVVRKKEKAKELAAA